MNPIRIGTRGSALALKQTDYVCEALRRVHPDIETEIVTIKTSGDWKPEQGEIRLSEDAGGKGLFVKEIEQALLDGGIDCAVHSMKDMPSFLPEGLVIEHMLPREDPRDCFLANGVERLEDLPEGAKLGTTSMRRQSQLLALRPDLEIVPLRGNVPTRIEKLRAGQVDATILAAAGLARLGLEEETGSYLEVGTLLPAAGQGAIGVEIRADDADMRELLYGVSCLGTVLSVSAERSALQALNGSCHTPIAAYATYTHTELFLRVMVAAPDGGQMFYEEERALVTDMKEAEALGSKLGHLLKDRVPEGILV